MEDTRHKTGHVEKEKQKMDTVQVSTPILFSLSLVSFVLYTQQLAPVCICSSKNGLTALKLKVTSSRSMKI